MAKKRTKAQKQRVQKQRKTEYLFTESGVSVQEGETTSEVVAKVAKKTVKKATTPKLEKGVKSSFNTQMSKLLYQDIRKTGIVTGIVFFVLFGIYAYIR